MYSNYTFYALTKNSNKYSISSKPFIMTDENDEVLIFQILRDIEFNIITNNNLNSIYVYAIHNSEKNKLSTLLNILNNNLNNFTNVKFIKEFKFDLNNYLNKNTVYFKENNLEFYINKYDYKKSNYLCNPSFYISKCKLNQILNL